MEIRFIRQVADLAKRGAFHVVEVELEGARLRFEGGRPPLRPVKSACIKSPLGGSFFSVPSGESEPRAIIGDLVSADTVIGEVVSEGTVSEITAGFSCRVTEILVDEGAAVEEGTELLRVSLP